MTGRWRFVLVPLLVLVACGGDSAEPLDLVDESSSGQVSVPEPDGTVRALPGPESEPPRFEATGRELADVGIEYVEIPDGFVAWGEAQHVDGAVPGWVHHGQQYYNPETVQTINIGVVSGVLEDFDPSTGLTGDQLREPSERLIQGYDTYTADLTQVSRQLQVMFRVEGALVSVVGFQLSYDELFAIADTIQLSPDLRSGLTS